MHGQGADSGGRAVYGVDCGRSPAGIAVSNLAGGMDVCVVFCTVRT